MPAGSGARRVAVFAPSTLLSITFEAAGEREEIHVHPAGQGFWVARMLAVLGDTPVLCTPIGGETGTALRGLLGEMPSDGLLACHAANGAYVHDRRSGERRPVAKFDSAPLDRHSEDDLVSLLFAAALTTPVAVVCGSNLDGNVEPKVFARVCASLRAGGTAVVSDLAGAELRSALSGGIDLLKISAQELVDDGWASSDADDDVAVGIEQLRKAGAADVVVSRAERGALGVIGGTWMEVDAPSLAVVDDRGAGDSMTAALAHGLLHEMDAPSTFRLAAAAAALNVTRHGLASGHRDAIQRLQQLVRVRVVDP